MVQFVNLRELKIQTSDVIRRSGRGDVVVTIRGKPRAIIHAIDDEELEAYLMEHSPAFIQKLEKTIREAREGKLYSHEEIFGHRKTTGRSKRHS